MNSNGLYVGADANFVGIFCCAVLNAGCLVVDVV